MKQIKNILVVVLLTIGFTLKAQTVETVFEDNTYQLTGVAVSKSGRVFTNYPRWAGPYQYALVEVGKNNKKTPFPDVQWNTWDVEKGGDKANHFLCVQAVVIDDKDAMWVVDAGYAKNAEGDHKGQKLVKINLKTNTVEKVYPLYPVLSAKSYANDIRIDTNKNIAYLTNSGEGGIIIVDLKSGKVRQVLLATSVTKADTTYVMKRNGKQLISNGKPFFVHSDGIALTPDAAQLYFKSLTDNKLYRIATSDLNDKNLSEAQLLQSVKLVGTFTTTDGMAFDKKGNLYLGDLEKRELIRITPQLKVETVLPANEDLAWPDSYSVTDNGWLYISLSRIDEEPRFHNGENSRKGPYKIVRVKLD
ncbi:SMP-30/gluconolactonase/LRE family protein [Flavobacterium sp. RHBU_3]|uniref:SMP-30/gluconolactonase/LRE family protein n=1 Tax=Flavobacterium sp. RHBU_3 TaxID=3391184 RepID=UPI003984A86A